MAEFSKKEMSEEDIKFRYVTPAVENKWSKNNIRMEFPITDGKINLQGNLAVHNNPKKADYILYIDSNPIAVIEAENNKHPVSFGMSQAREYAEMMDLPFAYSSNGDAFLEHDYLTGKETQFPLEDFPTPEELEKRYEEGENGGKGLSEEERKIKRQPYYTSQNTYSPRYYQRVAIDRVVEAVARGQQRILLVMATGTGKTYTAFQIVYRLLKAGLKKKVLYLSDRNFLVDQTISQDFKPLEKTIHKVSYAKDDPATITSYEVYFALYQQFVSNGNEDNEDKEDVSSEELTKRIEKLFSKDFFDFVIVDECHRGSAKKDSNWRKILEYFDSATQLGMTATPKETKYVSNIDYFGDPIYEYSLKQGIEDGFLAPFKVINITTDIGDGWRPYKGQRDIKGNIIEDRLYTNSDYDYNIIIQDRIDAVAEEITNYLKATDRMAKTIVFCPTEDAADRMRIALNNLNSDMVKEHPNYVVRITSHDDYGKGQLDYFISVASEYPVIATTSKLLSTGADCKTTKLIVIDEMINSMTEFKQIIGRGTRLNEKKGKTHFAIMDFRGVTRLFSDEDWDGPIEIDEEYDPKQKAKDKKTPQEEPPEGNDEPKTVCFVDKNGCTVRIINKTISVYDADCSLLRQENVIDYTKTNILGEYASLENFIKKWSEEDKKEAITEELREKGIDLEALKEEQHMEDVDDFDFICHIAYDAKPLTRWQRANNVKKRDFLNRYTGVAKEVLEALLEKYMNSGVYEIEKTEVLKLDPFDKFGSSSKIVKEFGGKEKYLDAVHELEKEIYEVG